jgi:hypothetical protein
MYYSMTKIILYNSIIDGVLGYNKRKERIAEYQEHKQLNIGKAKSKPVIIVRHPISRIEINSDLGLLAYTTTNHEISVLSTLTSDKVDSIQDAQDKPSAQQHPSSLFIHPAIEWQQEMLLVMDEVIFIDRRTGLAVFDCGVRNKITKVFRNKHSSPLNFRILALKCVFNSQNSGLLVFTDKGTVLDFSIKRMQPVSSLNIFTSGDLLDTSGIKEPNSPTGLNASSTLKSKSPDVLVNAKPQQSTKMYNSAALWNLSQIAWFIDSGGKNQICFLEDYKLVVTSK